VSSRKILGQNIRNIRLACGFSQEELADRAGLHRTYIGSVERGERNISLDNIVAIAEALDAPLIDLLRGITIHEE
jgi:transcriptional regulator with XRE-family HTH domain